MADASRQANPMTPSNTLVCKLGSAIVHADEALSPHGVPEDVQAFRALLNDPDLQSWMKRMAEMGLLPVKRDG